MADEASGKQDAGTTPRINVKFTCSDKPAGKVVISLQSTIGELKEAIRTQFNVHPKRLIFQGRILNKDEQTLAECKLQDGLTVVVQGTPGASPTLDVTATSTTPSASPSSFTAVGAATTAAPVTPVSQAIVQALAGGFEGTAASPVGQAVGFIRGQGSGLARECLTVLTKVVDNILAHPMEDKYRKIKRMNPGFRRKVGAVPGGENCMRALGFTEIDGAEGSWILHPSADAWNVLMAGRAEIQAALARLPAATSTVRSSGSTGATPGFAGGLGVLPPAGAYGTGGGVRGMGGIAPDMAMAQQMLQNPANVRDMMNDPTVQAMMRANPQMSAAMQQVLANPGLMSQAMNALNNNPALMAHAQRSLQDPASLQRADYEMGLDGAMRNGVVAAGDMAPGMGFPIPGGVGGGGAFAPAPGPSALGFPAAPPAPAPAPSGGEGVGEMTEDELLAEALRRSMEDS